MAAPAPNLSSAFARIGFTAAAALILADPAKESLDIEALKALDDKGVKHYVQHYASLVE
jgi:hypothetical protein